MASGFWWAGSLDHSEPIKAPYTVKASAVLSKGEMLNLESSEADAAATNDKGLIGVAVHDVDNTADGEIVYAIMNPGAIYGVEDANARTAGTLLDIATGGMGVTTSTNADLIVVYDSADDEPTLVAFNNSHYLNRVTPGS